MPCKITASAWNRSERQARGRGMSCKNYRQYLKHVTTASGAKGLEDPCPKLTPLVVVRDVKLDTSSFFDGLLRDRRCPNANS